MTNKALGNTTLGRSRGSIRMARSLWYEAPGKADIRSDRINPAPNGNLTIETHYSGLSRGTERLVWSGSVPASEWQRMTAPYQDGSFPFPVKYGYSAAGVVVAGPPEWIGRNTFALHPHQDVFQLPLDAVIELPDGVPLRRATLAANMETALNALWDSGAAPGDKIVVVGAGIVGLLISYLAARLPGANVHVLDIAAERQQLVTALGATFHQSGCTPQSDPTESIGDDADLVFHTSASAAGFNTAVATCGFEATLVEMSWYGDRDISVHLGGAFHSKRLRLIASQVGHVATNRRARWSHKRRLETAARLLDDPVLDELVGETVAFDDLPERLGDIFDNGAGGLAPVIAYPAAT